MGAWLSALVFRHTEPSDDASAKSAVPPTTNLTKGVQVYAYITVTDCLVEFSVPANTISRNQLNAWSSDYLVVENAKIPGLFKHKGNFSFRVYRHGIKLTHQWVQINIFTGELGNGTMNSPQYTPSMVVGGIIITYGFYNAGPGEAGLPSNNQCYVTVTQDCSRWMAEVARTGSPQAELPFSRFVLPSAHDVGMNDTQNTDIIFENAKSKMAKVLNGVVPLFGELTETWAGVMAPEIAYGLAFTQKDDLETMLAIGARYFEFRPAHIHKDILPYSGLEDKLYFQHACIPGMAYDEFLHGCVGFLVDHPSEIVVVQIRHDNILAGCALPTPAELQTYMDNAFGQASDPIACGTLDDLKSLTIAQLRASHKRLIVFPTTDVLSTWTKAANATLNGDSIIAAYEKLEPEQQKGHALTNLQCQATASEVTDVLVYSVTSPKASTSCLMSTKAICDTKTLPWIRENALGRLQAEELIVMMNGFIDGATVGVAVELSKKRLNA